MSKPGIVDQIEVGEKLYAVLSKTQDECTICNRIFKTYSEAWNYIQATMKASGCVMYTIAVQYGDWD